MSTGQAVQPATRPGTHAIAAGVLVGLSVLELGALVLPIPLPVVIVSVALIPPGLAAAVALWQGRRWGKSLGLVVATVTAIKGALGVALASGALARGGAGMALALGPICCALLIIPGVGGEE